MPHHGRERDVRLARLVRMIRMIRMIRMACPRCLRVSVVALPRHVPQRRRGPFGQLGDALASRAGAGLPRVSAGMISLTTGVLQLTTVCPRSHRRRPRSYVVHPASMISVGGPNIEASVSGSSAWQLPFSSANTNTGRRPCTVPSPCPTRCTNLLPTNGRRHL